MTEPIAEARLQMNVALRRKDREIVRLRGALDRIAMSAAVESGRCVVCGADDPVIIRHRESCVFRIARVALGEDEMRDPLTPQWEDCKVCGGDDWTKNHPDPTAALAEALRVNKAVIVRESWPEGWEPVPLAAILAALPNLTLVPTEEVERLRAVEAEARAISETVEAVGPFCDERGDELDLDALRAALEAKPA